MYEIKRDLLSKLKNHLEKKEITLIIGPRQVGKTTLMKKLKEFLEKSSKKTVFLNLDYEQDNTFFETQEKLLGKIKLEIGEKGYVFIDEIQRKENAGVFLKGIYDLDLDYKFIISGSGSLELKERINESLAGRKRMFECFPVNFKEFINYETNYKYENNFFDFLELEKEKVLNLLKKYLNFGGYPRVILETEKLEKKYIIDEIYKSYVLKDISYLLKIEKPDAFMFILKILSTQIGQILKYSELSKQVGISEKTIKNYIYYAENTFSIKKVIPFFRNKQKEIIKSPNIYFNDLGLRNYMIGVMGTLKEPVSLGFVFQNFVYKLLLERYLDSNVIIKFWRTLDGAEVDFVLDIGDSFIGVEVKFSHLKKIEITKSLRSFINKYSPKEILVVNLSLRKNTYLQDTKVKFVPFYDLLQ